MKYDYSDEKKAEILEVIQSGIADLQKVLLFQVDHNNKQEIAGQLGALHNILPTIVQLKERANLLLTMQYGVEARAMKAANVGIFEREKMINDEVNKPLLLFNWVSGLLNEAHHQKDILIALLNHIK